MSPRGRGPGMTSEDQVRSPISGWRVPGWAGALAGCVAALPLAWALWGFSVDDAFIPARVAAHVLEGLGPRFNPGGPVTDAVTPWGFAYWLAALSRLAGADADPLGVLAVARASGVLAGLGAAALLGRDLVSIPGISGKDLSWAFVGLLFCVPLGAWAGSGLETPWITLLATWSLRLRPGAQLSAGLAAALRPELLPWALALGLFRWKARQPCHWSGLARRLALVGGPLVLVSGVRWAWYGTPVPLSFTAKAPDLAHGLRYGLGVLLLSGPWWLLASRKALRSLGDLPREPGSQLAALGVHWVALVFAGGDWMPFFRLAVPVLPSVLFVAAALAVSYRRKDRRGWADWVRVAAVACVGGVLLVFRGEDARSVMDRRLELVEQGRTAFAESRRIAAVDVGWIGAASSAELVDLAGVTDPKIAALPGGHTTKRVSGGLLSARNVDTLAFLAERGQSDELWHHAAFLYGAEARLAPAAFDMGFRLRQRLALPGTPWEYLICTVVSSP